MTIKNVAARDQALAALHDAHIDLQNKRDELLIWLRRLTLALIDVDRDLIDISRTERQVSAIRFDGRVTS
jgi:hypothetical protein